MTFSSGVSSTSSAGLPAFKMRLQLFQNRFFRHRHFVAALGIFGDAVRAFFHGFQIGEDQFGGDGFDVANRDRCAPAT